MSENCTARIKNQHDDERCVLEAGHEDPEYGTDHAGPRHPVMGQLRWNDRAVGAVPHQSTNEDAAQANEPTSGWTQIEARAFNAVLPALRESGEWLPLSARRRVANAVLAELKRELDALADYENTINWHTTCVSCARVLDSCIRETERAERAEEQARALQAEVAAARTFAAKMRDFCSPHGVATDYADRLIETMDQAKGEHRDPAADTLAAEWHRRYQRLEDLNKDPDTPTTVVEHVRGELVGLRGALGVLLGGRVEGGTAALLGWSYYQEWRRRQEGQA